MLVYIAVASAVKIFAFGGSGSCCRFFRRLLESNIKHWIPMGLFEACVYGI